MENKLLTKDEVGEIGYDYSDLEMAPPDDVLFITEGDSMDDWVPVTGVVYDLDDDGETLLYYGEYESGLPHGISVDFHSNGRLKRKCHIFHGAIHGEDQQWDAEGKLVFQGEHVHGVLAWYKKWNSAGELIEQQKEPADDMLNLIETQRKFYENRDWNLR